MIVNPRLKELFAEIAEQANKYLNQRDDKKKYVRRLVKLYTTKLSEEEQIYVMSQVLDQLSYRSIVVDPDNLIALNNVKHRTYFVIFILTVLGMLAAAALFKTNSAINEIVVMMNKILTMISL